MRIKLLLNPLEEQEIRDQAHADMRSPTQWVSRVIVDHLKALRDAETAPVRTPVASQGTAPPWGVK